MLIAKNAAYGASAFEPLRIFSRADPVEQLNVRIDDKLSRIARGSEYAGDDTEPDLIGYLVLRRVARQLAEGEAVAETLQILVRVPGAAAIARRRGLRCKSELLSGLT